ncbi:MAG: hypothetical protein H7Z12_19930 [Rhodospirillaceae bacterium]|nr:hypothetical protein [Rhodospirillales bacterium]
MAFEVGEEREVALLLSFLECRPFILEGRNQYQYIGDQILPARSALEFIRTDMAAPFRTALDEFDSFIKANAEKFNDFFAYEHARTISDTALEDWVWGDDGKTPAVPETHWWWKPLDVAAQQVGGQ